MLFVIIGRDGPEAKALRPKLREAHLAHLEAYVRQDRIRLAGPLTDGTGSLIVLEAASLEEAGKIAEADPYSSGGVFVHVELHPFLQVLPRTEWTEP